MGLFGSKESKEEKEEKQLQEFMNRYQLEDLDAKDLVILKRIASDLAGKNFLKAGLAFSFTKAEEQAKIAYLSVLVEQNWMLIRQMSRMNKSIEELLNK